MRENIVSNKPVGIWIRVSTDDQAQGESPAHHEQRAREYAKNRGWVVKEVYDLAGQSGKAVMQHPEAKRMMRDVQRGHITLLLFSKLARLSRNRRELEDFSDFFSKHDADLMSLSEAIDTTSAGGRMFFHLLGVFAQWEREEITERVTASVLTRAKLGKSINGRAPYGYEWKDRRLIIKPEEAVIRRKAYEDFFKCRRKEQVAKQLNALGYRTREGSIWRGTGIERILSESSAKGIYLFNTSKLVGTWRTEPKPESEWGRVECPPIVSEELWSNVNRIMEEQLKVNRKPGKAAVHLFSGIAHCACDGTPKMYVDNKTPKYFCRKCRNRVPAEALEKVIREELNLFFGQPNRVAAHLETAQRNISEKSALVDTHRKEIQKVRDEMQATHQLYLKNQISGDGFRDLYGPAEERLKQLQAALPKLEADLDVRRVDRLSAEDVVKGSNTLYDRWPSLDPKEKRQIVEALIERIEIGDGKLRVKYSQQPTSLELCKSQQRLGPGRGGAFTHRPALYASFPSTPNYV